MMLARLNDAWMREYAVPIAVTVLLHFVLLLWLSGDFHSPPEPPKVSQPKYIKLTTDFSQKQKEKKKPVKKAPPKKKDKPLPKTKKVPKKVKEKSVPLKKKKDDDKLKKQKEELEKKKKAQEEERLRKQAELEKKRREDELLSNLPDEIEPDEPEIDTSADEKTAQSYMSAIRDAVAANWSRPPSARNGMQVTLRIQLVPTGQVVNVSIVKSSGNNAFDRSAVAAVDKAEKFPELQELESRIFEQYYRRFDIVFRPEDLRL